MPARKKPIELSQTQACSLAGVSLRTFSSWHQGGNPPPATKSLTNENVGYPPREFGIWLRNKWARDAGIAEDGKVYDPVLEKARLLHHQANNEALKERVNRGELVAAQEVIDLGAAMIGAARAKLLGIHNKVRGRFPGIDSAIADQIEQMIKEALAELGSDGIPADLRRRLAPAIRSLESSTDADD